jgi:NAD(P)-dependent dehydrogenase (short-subunit alcohol dehydrogenase family)
MTGRRFLITGASKGIGLATAHHLAARGDTPVGLARTSPNGFPGEFIPVDLGDRSATAEAIDQALAAGQLDGVLNNVGTVHPQMLGEIELDDFEAVFDLTVRSTIQTVQALMPGMIERGWGRIVNISSVVALGGVPGRSSYGAAKATMEHLTRIWGQELAPHGITVNDVAPGPVATDLFRQSNPEGSPGEARYLSMVPMGKLGTVDDIAAAVCFFMSDHAGWITGQTLRVDGGASIGRASLL